MTHPSHRNRLSQAEQPAQRGQCSLCHFMWERILQFYCIGRKDLSLTLNCIWKIEIRYIWNLTISPFIISVCFIWYCILFTYNCNIYTFYCFVFVFRYQLKSLRDGQKNDFFSSATGNNTRSNGIRKTAQRMSLCGYRICPSKYRK